MTGLYLYKNKQVYVTNYQATGFEGRICNWVSFQYVRKDGSLGKKGGDYLRQNNFKPLKFKLIVLLKKGKVKSLKVKSDL